MHRLQLASESFCRTIYLQTHQCSRFCFLSGCLSRNMHNSQWLGAIANLKEDHQRWSYPRKPWNCQTPYFQVKFQIFSSFFFSVFPLLHKKYFFLFQIFSSFSFSVFPLLHKKYLFLFRIFSGHGKSWYSEAKNFRNG